jgi:hypothetical protein
VVRFLASVALAALVVVAAPAVHAAELTLSGPGTCRDRDELIFRVERALGAPLSAAPPLELAVTIEQRARGHAARLSVRDGADAAPSERTLEAADCARLLDALSVVIVLAIDRVRAEEHAPAEPESVAPPVPASTAPSIPDAVVAQRPDSSTASWRPSAHAWLAADVGSLPNVAPGVALGLSLDTRRARLQVSGLFLFEQHVELPGQGTPVPGADVGLALGALSACFAPGGSWRSDGVLGVCARGELGRLFGRGSNVRNERTGGRLWVAPGLSVTGEWTVLAPSLRLGAEAGAVLPLLRSEVRLGTLGELYRPAAVSARAGLGLMLVLE